MDCLKCGGIDYKMKLGKIIQLTTEIKEGDVLTMDDFGRDRDNIMRERIVQKDDQGLFIVYKNLRYPIERVDKCPKHYLTVFADFIRPNRIGYYTLGYTILRSRDNEEGIRNWIPDNHFGDTMNDEDYPMENKMYAQSHWDRLQQKVDAQNAFYSSQKSKQWRNKCARMATYEQTMEYYKKQSKRKIKPKRMYDYDSSDDEIDE